MTVYRPDAACPNPKCQRRPAIDIPEEEREAARNQPPGQLRLHYICRGCGWRFAIYAAAFADAQAVPVTKFVGNH